MEYNSSDELKNNEKGNREWYENSIHEKSDWKSFRERRKKKVFSHHQLDNNVEVFIPQYGYVYMYSCASSDAEAQIILLLILPTFHFRFTCEKPTLPNS